MQTVQQRLPCILAVLYLNLVSITAAAGPTGMQIMQECNKALSTKTESFQGTLTLMHAKGGQQIRTIQAFVKSYGPDERRQFVEYLTPADVKGTKLLTYDYRNEDDDRWLYLPALGNTRRISAAEQTERFMGTDFSYEDMQVSFDLQQWSYDLGGEEACGDRMCYQIRARPATSNARKRSGYSERRLWIDKATYLVLRSDFFDKQDRLTKRLVASEVRPVSGSSFHRAFRLEMEDMITKHRTIIVFLAYRIDHDISDRIFNPRFLTR